MKKLILLFLPFVSIFLNAEELKFVTVLSSPVGTFNKLEAVDPAAPAKSPVINFCTGVGSGGTVTLKGSSRPEMNTVNIASDAVLGRSGGTYVLRTITMGTGGELKGSRLLANTLNVNYSTAGKSTNLYTKSLTVAGAKTQTLDVNNGDSKITAQHGAADMVWSNQYQSDKACGNTTECAKQYLLKQKGGSSGGGSTGTSSLVWKKTGGFGRVDGLVGSQVGEYTGDESGCFSYCNEFIAGYYMDGSAVDSCGGNPAVISSITNQPCTSKGEQKNCVAWGELLADSSCNCYAEGYEWTCTEK